MILKRTHILPVVAMATIVLAANIAVQFPIFWQIGEFQLADALTYGAFAYPFVFLVTDLTNRRFGPAVARRVVYAGFATAVLCSVVVPPILVDLGLLGHEASAGRLARVAMASGAAFLVAQLVDIAIFNRLRRQRWWHAPVVSTVTGSVIDTTVFFSLAFASAFLILGPGDGYALAEAPIFGVFSVEAPRWVSWALGDLMVKLSLALIALVPYRIAIARMLPSATPYPARG